MGKKYLVCENGDCGNVQCVKSNEMWSCGACKRRQLVDGRAVRDTNGRGRRLRACRRCGYVQSVGADIWMCTACHESQPAHGTAAPAAGAAGR